MMKLNIWLTICCVLLFSLVISIHLDSKLKLAQPSGLSLSLDKSSINILQDKEIRCEVQQSTLLLKCTFSYSSDFDILSSYEWLKNTGESKAIWIENETYSIYFNSKLLNNLSVQVGETLGYIEITSTLQDQSPIKILFKSDNSETRNPIQAYFTNEIASRSTNLEKK